LYSKFLNAYEITEDGRSRSNEAHQEKVRGRLLIAADLKILCNGSILASETLIERYRKP